MKTGFRWRRFFRKTRVLGVVLFVLPVSLSAALILAVAGVVPAPARHVELSSSGSNRSSSTAGELSSPAATEATSSAAPPHDPQTLTADDADRRWLTAEDKCGLDQALKLFATRQLDVTECDRATRYLHDRFTITLRPRQFGDELGVQADVRQPGLPRLRLPPLPPSETSVAVGQLDRSGARYVILAAFTGGFHCCVNVYVVVPEGRNRGVYPIASFEAGTEINYNSPPSDIDGDGVTDFVGRDTRFFYEFTGYSGTERPPPWIFNIRDGRLVDVSAEPRYRHLFEQAAAELRPLCLTSSIDNSLNTACPQYLAASARLGQFERAWREVWSRHAVEAPADWCGFRHGGDRRCRDLPTHLLHFLRTHDYLTEDDVTHAPPAVVAGRFAGRAGSERSVKLDEILTL